MTRWFWAALAAFVLLAAGLTFWQTGNRTTVAPPMTQSPPIAPAVPTAAQAPASDTTTPTIEKEPAAAPAAPTVAQAPSTNAAAPTAKKEPSATPSAPTAAQVAPDAASPTAEKESAAAAPTAVAQAPGTEPAPSVNAKATAEQASLKPDFSMKDLLASLNESVINFESGSSELPASMASFLQNAAHDLKQMHADYTLEIAGYTDNTGDAARNVVLSQRRADAVRQALVKSGANADMLVAKGYGSADPIASNDTPEGRLRNRRIEYRLLKTPDKH